MGGAMTESSEAKEERGKRKQELGERLGDEELEAEGREEKLAGKARQAGEVVRETVDEFKDALKGR
jgi:uncharacterized protein YjbJ (UPF0337 family)